MNQNDSLLRRPLFWAVAVYCAGFAALLPFLVYHIDADGISYISIARHYLDGDFALAVNGYWGPLFSWLLMPFMAAGINPLVSAKLAGFASGLLALWGARRLCAALGLSLFSQWVVLLSLAPVGLSFFCQLISPDLLLAAILAHYFVFALRDDFGADGREGLACGALGGLAYLAKSYALPFFAIHFTAICFARRQFRTWAWGMAVFALVCGAWGSVLSLKYGGTALTTAGRYNRDVVGPSYKGHPVNYEGFFAPANGKAASIWEDPSLIETRRWSMFDSRAAFLHQLRLLADNFVAECDALQAVSLFSCAVILWLLLEALSGDRLAAAALFSAALYCAGYLPIVARARYLYPVYLLLAVCAGKLLDALCENAGRRRKFILAAGLAGSFLITPAYNIAQSVNSGRGMFMFSRDFGMRFGAGHTLASGTRWMETLYAAYHTNSRYIGQAAAGIEPGELARQLSLYGADYFFSWSGRPLAPEGWAEVSGGKYKGILIYAPPERGEKSGRATSPPRHGGIQIPGAAQNSPASARPSARKAVPSNSL